MTRGRYAPPLTIFDFQRKPWTTAEEAAFDRVVNSIVRTHLWAAAKNEPILAKRGNSSVRSHWEAKVSPSAGWC